ncbi:hypothetical protein TTHERM_00263000 (macronuclear) [Tetrahymena thermophila SB210]|uniref:WD domain, G-beta repeat protein n=1 Tax=Tetrahymena thermophila (strain SB210) TaxID=312017 RepID=Q22U83_TETTS|nr:hypothetical protein TTHERM_00263000 [Tetrahymena thermophila SB210]EAR88804.2 hypothetical protein TTHERM_00263000 [Tetrahymena thermophila SB210]|eukprot:XP_001009049.2 hypothetical protein TTHERM_00263000 [Tetrahymena thermophila SB210]
MIKKFQNMNYKRFSESEISDKIDQIQTIQHEESLVLHSDKLIWSRCVYFQEGQFVVGLSDGQVLLVDTLSSTSKTVKLQNSPQFKVKDIAFLQKNSLMVTCYIDAYIHIWSLKNDGQLIKQLPYKSYNSVAIKDRYLAFISSDMLNEIIILDSHKFFSIVQKIQAPIFFNGQLNSIRFINSFHPCSNLFAFVDRLYFYVYDFYTKHYVKIINLKAYGSPYKIKTYKKDNFYYAAVLFMSEKFIVIDIIKGEIIYKSKILESSYDSTVLCCEFVNRTNIIMGFSDLRAYIINFITDQIQMINNDDGFVGAFVYKNKLFTTADKTNKLHTYILN